MHSRQRQRQKSKPLKYLSYLQLLILFTACQPSDQAPTFRAPIAADSIDASAVMKGITVSPTLFSDSIRAAVAGKNLRRFMANSELLRIGHFKTVWKDTDLELEWGLDTLEPGPLADLDNYAFKDAHEEVIKQAKAHQLVIIAENHNRPQHRVFTACLLEDLYAIGYRHLGMEALLNLHKDPAGGLVDTAMQKRGYPLTWMLSGTYTNEPEFANLIRAATDLGFQLFAYERNQSSESERDLQMAEHVIAYQKKHPGEKILLHGGWYHAIESDQTKPDGANWMAYHYKTMTGDDPLTVYQDALNEKLADNQRSSPYYQHLIDTRELPAKPQVLVDGSGRLYKGPDGKIPSRHRYLPGAA